VLETYEKFPQLKEQCPYVFETHLRRGNLRSAGDTLVQPALVRLLEGIAATGADFFYKGTVAQAIAREMKQRGGLIREEDLGSYEVKSRAPVRFQYREFEIIGVPPPSSGGIALAETLNILEAVEFASVVKRDPPLAIHYQIEAMKHAFADRARWLGDPDFTDVPVAFLASGSRAGKLASRLNPERVTDLDGYGSSAAVDDAGTSHFCVADRWGNVVASSETVNTEFGSLVAIDEWGLILNNEMDDFAAEPGKPNAFGLVHGPGNAVASRKRPLSSMTPTIVLKGDQPYLLLGGSGGPRIISSVLNVLLGVTDLELSLEEAMIRLRPHHQWKPETVFFDAEPPSSLAEDLIKRGHAISPRRRSGNVQAILRTGDGWIGASDPRKGGRPAAY
jgi:gamma-glutamyltranspeptidase/glutathione hydrolase